MPKHKQPTQEELKEIEDLAIKEAEDLAQKEAEGEVDPIQAEPSQEVKEQLKREVEEKNKKLSASARENQKIYAKNRIINKALVEADEVPEPTDEELSKEFTDWDVMSEVERSLAKETVISKKWRQLISSAKEQATKIEKWNDSVGEFTEDPETLVKHPELEGRLEGFKEYATQEENNSVPLKTLVNAFLYENERSKESNKGSMFEKSLGGSNEKPQPRSDTITIEEARVLRETDYNKWKEYLQAGKIKSEF